MIPDSLVAGVSANVQRALDFALSKIGVCEDPPGSNRGPEIDAWADEFDSPRGSRWCALSVGAARRAGGLWVPKQYVGCCDEWLYSGKRAGLVTSSPVPGAAVVYTNGKKIQGGRYDGQLDAVRIALVLRVTPVTMDIEGNTSLGVYDHDGFVQALKRVELARVLAYIAPATAGVLS